MAGLEYPGLYELKNRHHSEVAWIVGNGKSVRLEDLARIDSFISLGANRVYLAYGLTDWRPNYLVSADELMISDFGEEMCAHHHGTVFFVSNTCPDFSNPNFLWIRSKGSTPLKFATDVAEGVPPGGGTLIAAIQIGFFLGITKFVLYGVDHKFSYETPVSVGNPRATAAGGDNHFIPNYREGKPWQAPIPWQAESSFLMAHRFLQARGGWVLNATHGGELNSLRRISFEKAVSVSELNLRLLEKHGST